MMRRILILFALLAVFSLSAKAQVPPRGLDFNPRQWEAYAEHLIKHKLFPGDPLADEIKVEVEAAYFLAIEPNAYACNLDGKRGICINDSLILQILPEGNGEDVENEFASLLAHEYAHHALGHIPTKDLTLDRKQELAADWLMAQTLSARGYDLCAAERFIERGVRIHRAYSDRPNPYDARVKEQIGLRKVYCFNKDKLQYLRPPE